MHVFITLSMCVVCLPQGIFLDLFAVYCFFASNYGLYFASVCMYKKRICHDIVTKSVVFLSL